MKPPCVLSCLTTALLLLAVPLSGQDSTDLEVKLKQENGKAAFESSGGISSGDSLVVVRDPLPLKVRCGNGVDCSKVTVTVDGQPVNAASKSQQEAAFNLSLAANETKKLVVSHDTNELFTSNMTGTDTGTGKVETDSVAEMLQNPCENPPSGVAGYDRKGNRAVVLVTATGAVLEAPVENMDEDDILEVHVFADPRLFANLAVKRKSPIRTVGSLNLVGAGGTISTDRGQAAVPCEIRSFSVKDFAPGEGEVEITVLNDESERVSVGNFNFLVHKLYHGMLSFGAIRSEISDKEFGLAPQGDDKVIVLTENGGRETFYAVFYTPFVWGKRDIEKEPLEFKHRINPSFGITLDDFSDNAVAGVSVDVGTFVFTGGVHLARVKKLSEKSGLAVGDVFEGEATEIPTTREWEWGSFVSVSIDLRAAVQLLQTLASGDGD